MDKCIQFKGLSHRDRAVALHMAKRSLAFWVYCQGIERRPELDEVCWLIEQTAEHLSHMNRISGGKYGEDIATELDV
jgi:hypothetical protein